MSDFLSDSDFTRIRDLIYNESGIHFSDSNRTILESRLKERLKLQNLESIGEYYKSLTKSDNELKDFLDSVTTNLTRFFRNQAHYDTFINYVIPDLVERKRQSGDKKISIWSAGCSTGEEPYTNAMVLKEHLPPDFKIEVIASDLSLKSLMKAKEGLYLKSRVTGIPDNYLNKYFTEEDNSYRVKPEIVKLIKFDYHNLKFGNDMRNLDIVFCRNVLIYFDEPAQKNVIDNFWNSMAPHSYLFIGHSESLFGMDTQFKFIKTDWACIYGKIQN
ncbi:protein-glutamate O-methyltransferase CheR [Oceanispirochaeta crateris]|uniref:protein-glutamate O-methyltransferase n=1 Tax=Oceanispirochaeta crateris TaxID=2518645 RepID=A0A5C1QT49_9SPIO|nr:protein-glutamate O-methyltransferase CheR [Oceanispirochaeta crateris]QEN09192.1 protein-glutamate O-methyltransferase CheR [Oceanispirochaeta crateris]